MKPLLRAISLLLFVSCQFNVFSQHRTELNPGYYIVVGAYAPTRENVAQNYVDVLTRRGFNAGYGFNSGKNYFFVYLKYFTDLKSSLSDMQNTRKQPEFAGAWVRVVPGEIVGLAKQTPAPLTKEPEKEKAHEKKLVSNEPSGQVPVSPVRETGDVTVVSPPDDGIVVTDNPEIVQYPRMTLGNTEVFLSLYDEKHNKIVDGTVKVIDAERGTVLKNVKGNEYFNLPDPRTKSGQLRLVCEAFGYKPVEHNINYNTPLADTIQHYIELLGTTFVVNFDLDRYGKNDVGILGNVTFYNDAAIMMPSSKEEITGLLQMMQENPTYRIMLHGHTNGNYNGRIITMGEKKNFFSLEGSKSGTGSARDLSYERAEVIKEYLVANGIDGSRMEVKGWGGKKPLFDKHSVNAKRNVRVEVEILQE